MLQCREPPKLKSLALTSPNLFQELVDCANIPARDKLMVAISWFRIAMGWVSFREAIGVPPAKLLKRVGDVEQ
jgi:hypothetical protein